MLSKIDHKKRSKGIGSSEIAMLVYLEDEHGDMKPLSPWGGRHTLWRRKTGRDGEQEAKSYMTRGQFMELGLINWYAHDKDIEWKAPKTIRSKKYPYVVDSCDGLTYPKGSKCKGDPLRCVEAKTSSYWKKDEWGQDGTDEIPDYYLVQSLWHLGAHRPQEMICDVPMDNGTERKDYHIPFDEEVYLSLVSLAEKFWIDYVKKDKEPPVDSYSETTTWLSKYLKQRDGMGLLEADDEQVKMLLRYREEALSIKSSEERLDEMREPLMRIIGEHEGITIPGTKQRILWRKSKDRSTINWKNVAEQLAQALHVDGKMNVDQFKELQGIHTKTTEGSRRWIPTSLIKASK